MNPVEERLEKLDYLTRTGHEPFKMSVGCPTDIDIVRNSFKSEYTKDNGPEYVIAGRVALHRGHGKLQFLTISSENGQIQVAIDASKFAGPIQQRWDWPEIERVDLGDIVAVKGRLAATQRGEITIWASEFRIVSKALTPPPDKVHGLNDPELRYRNRHVDMWTNPEVMKVFHLRSRIVKAIRDYMHGLGFNEVETPIMQPSAGGAAAKPFTTHHNALDIPLYLRIAPELYLKRLLMGGMKKVFEIGKNFRNEGVSPKHNPEFTVLEAYEAFGNRDTMMSLTEDMIRYVVREVFGKFELSYQGQIIDFSQPFKRVKLAELVVGDDSPEYKQKIYEGAIEPTLIQPTFVLDMPASTVPLAASNNGYAEVFELVIAGMEIAPGYTELNDPIAQQKNFSVQGGSHIMDQDFIDAMKCGMPPAGGMGLGIDRLVAILTDQPTIREVIPFPLLKPVT